MRAVTYQKYGSPHVLELAEIPKPIPKEDEILVNIHAVSINSWDWDMLTGTPLEYRIFSGLLKPRNNLIHGCDIAGIVEAVGKNSRGIPLFGDRRLQGEDSNLCPIRYS